MVTDAVKMITTNDNNQKCLNGVVPTKRVSPGRKSQIFLTPRVSNVPAVWLIFLTAEGLE